MVLALASLMLRMRRRSFEEDGVCFTLMPAVREARVEQEREPGRRASTVRHRLRMAARLRGLDRRSTSITIRHSPRQMQTLVVRDSFSLPSHLSPLPAKPRALDSMYA